jgi:hypothetical protein
MCTEDGKRKILVLGDVHSNRILRPSFSHEDKQEKDKRRLDEEVSYESFQMLGGAFFTSECIKAALENTKYNQDQSLNKRFEVVGCRQEVLKENREQFVESVLELGQYPKAGGGNIVRVRRFLGWNFRGQRTGAVEEHDAALLKICSELMARLPETVQISVLVLHDSNNGFRQVTQSDQIGFLDKILRAKKPPGAIVLRLDEWAAWRFWKELKLPRERTVVIVRDSTLQKAGFNFRSESSIEQHAADLDECNQEIQNALPCRHLVMRFFNGVLHIDNDAPSNDRIKVIFSPTVNEEPSTNKEQGFMFGNTAILTASIVAGIVQRNGNLDGVWDGVRTGARTIEALYKKGFNQEAFNPKVAIDDESSNIGNKNDSSEDANKDRSSKIFFNLVGLEPSDKLTALTIPDDIRKKKKWSRIDGIVAGGGHPQQSAGKLAVQIVRYGVEQGLKKCKMPCHHAEFGKIKTVDRHEIDRFSSIQVLMRKYHKKKDWKEPLSIAVFGQPGSGKSFTVKEILSDVNAEAAKRPLEFNVAQFTGVKDLATAFHQAQDRALADEVPLVIFDEFDSNEGTTDYGWLKYFLAPMQDGRFKDGDNVYRVGRAILLFVGGTCHCFRDFEKLADLALPKSAKFGDAQPPKDAGSKERRAQSRKSNVSGDPQLGEDADTRAQWAKSRKLPDFISRLRGHLDIKGIGRNGSRSEEETKQQIYVRRAILLRALIESKLSQIVDPNTKEARIDENVIQTLVTKAEYRHGARSLEAVLHMAVVEFDDDSSHRLTRSSLPPDDQLGMHVEDVRVFNLDKSDQQSSGAATSQDGQKPGSS